MVRKGQPKLKASEIKELVSRPTNLSRFTNANLLRIRNFLLSGQTTRAGSAKTGKGRKAYGKGFVAQKVSKKELISQVKKLGGVKRSFGKAETDRKAARKLLQETKKLTGAQHFSKQIQEETMELTSLRKKVKEKLRFDKVKKFRKSTSEIKKRIKRLKERVEKNEFWVIRAGDYAAGYFSAAQFTQGQAEAAFAETVIPDIIASGITVEKESITQEVVGSAETLITSQGSKGFVYAYGKGQTRNGTPSKTSIDTILATKLGI